jgi:riboflavin biosynthesis pyrimidine reductase
MNRRPPVAPPAVRRLYPDPAPCMLDGLFLGHELHLRGQRGNPFVYTNFISTLDGRISQQNPRGYREVPPACTNPHDLRLYHELTAQADVVLTTSRHLKAAASGRGAGMLGFGDWAAELVQWRTQRKLPPHPRIAAVSGDLDLPERARLAAELGAITVITVAGGKPEQAEAKGYRVITCGGPTIDGRLLIEALGPECRTVCSVAGPRVHSALLRARRLDRLYLTLVQLLLGGDEFDTLTAGAGFAPPAAFSLVALYHDPAEPQGTGQLFAVLDRH